MIQPELITVYNINYSAIHRSNHSYKNQIHNLEIYSPKYFLNNLFLIKNQPLKWIQLIVNNYFSPAALRS